MSAKLSKKAKLAIIISAAAAFLLIAVAIILIVVFANPKNDDLKIGQKDKIFIGQGNGSVGYVWEIREISNENIISQIDISTELIGCKDGETGCSNNSYLNFVGNKSGETTVVVQKCYRGDCADAPIKTFHIEVK